MANHGLPVEHAAAWCARMRRNALPPALTLGLSLATVLFITTERAQAHDAAPTGIPDPSIATSLPPGLADPFGVRRDFASRGVTFGAVYIDDYFAVVDGGLERDGHYDGRLEFYLDADLGKLAGLKGLTFHINGYQIHGTSITGESLGSLAPASFIEAEPSTRLFEMWVEQSLFDGALTIMAGQLAADSEFFISDGAGAFINGTWGWPTISASNLPGGGPAFPLATPGVRVAVNPEGDTGFMAAVYNGEVADDCPDGEVQRCNSNGLDFPMGDGALVMAEGFMKYKVAGGAYHGSIKLGGWTHTGDVPDLVNPAISNSSNYGLYAIWDQMIVKLPGDRHIDVFARITGAPSDRNEIDLYAEGGIVVWGPFDMRPRDVFGIGVAYTRISDGARQADVDAGEVIIRDYEAVIEASYTAEVVPGLTLQPDIQYFWNPGGRVPDAAGSRAVEDALVIGIRSTLSY